MPTEIDQLERRATELEIERQALKKETDPNSQERLAQVEKELAGLREQSNALKARWKQEKEAIAKVRQLKERIEQLKLDEAAAERKGNLELVAQIRYGELRQVQAELERLNARLDGNRSDGSAARMLKEEVDEEDIARIISKWTGIPRQQDAGRRSQKTGRDGEPSAVARDRPGCRFAARGQCYPALARGPE